MGAAATTAADVVAGDTLFAVLGSLMPLPAVMVAVTPPGGVCGTRPVVGTRERAAYGRARLGRRRERRLRHLLVQLAKSRRTDWAAT
jgi:hypothetical protein